MKDRTGPGESGLRSSTWRHRANIDQGISLEANNTVMKLFGGELHNSILRKSMHIEYSTVWKVHRCNYRYVFFTALHFSSLPSLAVAFQISICSAPLSCLNCYRGGRVHYGRYRMTALPLLPHSIRRFLSFFLSAPYSVCPLLLLKKQACPAASSLASCPLLYVQYSTETVQDPRNRSRTDLGGPSPAPSITQLPL